MFRDRRFRGSLHGSATDPADMTVTPDGMPLVWVSRLRGHQARLVVNAAKLGICLAAHDTVHVPEAHVLTRACRDSRVNGVQRQGHVDGTHIYAQDVYLVGGRFLQNKSVIKSDRKKPRRVW